MSWSKGSINLGLNLSRVIGGPKTYSQHSRFDVRGLFFQMQMCTLNFDTNRTSDNLLLGTKHCPYFVDQYLKNLSGSQVYNDFYRQDLHPPLRIQLVLRVAATAPTGGTY